MFECGATHMWINRRTGDGHIVRLAPSVYGMPGVQFTFRRKAMAAVLSARAYGDLRREREGNPPPVGDFARRMAEMLTSAGIAMPVFEHRVVVDGHEYFLDLAWPGRMVAVECNDAGSHDTPKAFRRDPM